MLYLIGLGLGDEKDITVRGFEIVKRCDFVYLEHYTSILSVGIEKLEAFYGKKLILADREMVESGCETMLEQALLVEVAFLIVGDPFGATTHTDLQLRALRRGVRVEIVHNASIMTAIGCCGMQLYHFGPSVSIVFFEGSWRPSSFYDRLAENRKRGLHTLCLLDIKMKEQSTENLLRGNRIFEPPRFMSIGQCIEQLLEVENERKENAYDAHTPCIGLARIGHSDQKIVSGSMSELKTVDFGRPLHCLIIPGDMHFLEKECFDHFRLSNGVA